MNAEKTAPQGLKPQPDLRWPSAKDGLIVGIITLLILSSIMILLQRFYPQANHNPWFVTVPQKGYFIFQKSTLSIFTAHFFHGDWDHLWGNLLGLWVCGLIAFTVAGYPRAFAAIGWGILFAGAAQLAAGTPNVAHMGSSSIVFAFIGLIIPAAIRKGTLFIILMVLGMSYIDDMVFETIRPSMTTKVMHISWLGHLGGLIGGIMADLQDPTEAIRVLYKRGLISDKLTEKLLRKSSPERYEDTVAVGAKQAPAAIATPLTASGASPASTPAMASAVIPPVPLPADASGPAQVPPAPDPKSS
jgi:membrane associated rhomboid family serine protease